MLVTGAKKPDEIEQLLTKLVMRGLLGLPVVGVSVHALKLSKKKLSNKLYMKDIQSAISDHYKNQQ
ncbi:hypothetical protein [Paenibacillus sp. Leaf72]|uniref:hypothetical protein n=1 Tax=Paenibacillus sp. Leaf72 TaxID=1736234 RepID=UPI0006F59457|nr:hypothetical protein [Paenibacillus sp. Leaf72]KQO06237.1 hypothetical protein ASF12_32585 [Paenibacillus sp. Leaf72]